MHLQETTNVVDIKYL